ncbi:uncharacterized protein [Watersipora subatra]|uniref:uncharacterized protein n=1 Tax=Watersipora subatra TaxID=2589382 RepID=UPI00355C9ADA
MLHCTGSGVAVLLSSISVLFNFASGNWLARNEDNTKYAYGCLNAGVVSIACSPYEIITIVDVAYGGEPEEEGCPTKFTQQNDCQQSSASLTESAKKDCNGKPKCEVPILSLNSEQLRIDEVIPLQDSCDVDSKYYVTVSVNYMVVKYKCQDFLFCTNIDETPVAGLTVRTKDFPVTSIANPTCNCHFQAEGDTTYLQMLAMCNGTVTFVIDEMIDNPDPEPQTDYVTVKNRYFCHNQLEGRVLRMGTDNTVAMTVSVDTDNSSEFSSFSLNLRVLVKRYNNNQVSFRTKNNGRTLVSCNKGALWLPKTVRILLATLIPLGVILLITLIVVCRYVKRRRKRAKDWRRKNVSLRGIGYEPNYPDAPLHSESVSPTNSNASSLPSYTRRKPDGKLDSESDDELGRVAAKLHRRNTERRADELKKREEYYNNNNTPSDSFSRFPQRMPVSKSQTYDLDHYPTRNKEEVCQRGDQRCMSIPNLQPAGDDDASSDSSRPYRINRSRSVSQPRQRPRVNRTPDSPIFASGNRRHNPRNLGDLDPDLTFDDPRYTNGSRACTPVRSLQRPLYAEQLSHSFASLDTPARGQRARSRPLHGTKSASQSRTSLRSMKRKAPLPPGYSPASQRNNSSSANNQRAAPGTPQQNRASPFKKQYQRYNQSNPPNGSVNYTQNNRKNNASSGKSKFVNPYPVRYPPRKTKPKSHHSPDDSNDGPSSALVMGAELPKPESRRYSDGGSQDESEHGIDETPVELFGMDDNDEMYDDGGW